MKQIELKVRERTGQVLHNLDGQPEFRGYLRRFAHEAESALLKISRLRKPIIRARETYRLYEEARKVDEALKVKNIVKRYKVSCKKGCGACCAIRVTVSPDEADLLLSRTGELGIDMDYVARQAGRKASDLEWWKANKEDSWCAFLDKEKGECRVYDDRPLMCRDMEVASPAEDCSWADNYEWNGKPILFVVSPMSAVLADMSASLLAPEDVDVDMPTALLAAKARRDQKDGTAGQ